MSRVRRRVAMSDWWASRMLVSVRSTRSCSSSQCAKPDGPSSSSLCLVPGAGGGSATAGRRTGAKAAGRGRPLVSGLPLTMMSPMKVRMRLARSRLRGQCRSAGVSSMKRVV